MIYFDNAATTLCKPPGVAEAVAEAVVSLGNAGRGAHGVSLDAARMIYGVQAFQRGGSDTHSVHVGRYGESEYRYKRHSRAGRSSDNHSRGAQFRAETVI